MGYYKTIKVTLYCFSRPILKHFKHNWLLEFCYLETIKSIISVLKKNYTLNT